MSVGNAVKINNYHRPVDLLDIAQRGKGTDKTAGKDQAPFKQMFSQELAADREVTFSKHAAARLHSRGIEITGDMLAQLADAIDKAESKGSRETLVLTDDSAMVVSVENRTVITAFDRENLREGIVTSIDSAVIL